MTLEKAIEASEMYCAVRVLDGKGDFPLLAVLTLLEREQQILVYKGTHPFWASISKLDWYYKISDQWVPVQLYASHINFKIFYYTKEDNALSLV